MPELRLGSWNIHMGIGVDGRRDLGRTAQVIREMETDVLGLQEVDNHVANGADDIEQLQAMTGLQAVSGPTMAKVTGDYGNALLTRLPVLDVERRDISVHSREPRGILIVHLDWQGERVQVAVTHLGLRPGERRSQVRQLIGHLAGRSGIPLILLGDFNEWLFWGRPLRWLRRHFGAFHSPATFPSRWPLLSLDHILADPAARLRPASPHRTPLSRVASDHLPLVAVYTR
jgi:endonuclease/exonuclease/phosphatase family metal-dependent hydrolase